MERGELIRRVRSVIMIGMSVGTKVQTEPAEQRVVGAASTLVTSRAHVRRQQERRSKKTGKQELRAERKVCRVGEYD